MEVNDALTKETLLLLVKDSLGISWEDEMTDRRLMTIIENGLNYIEDKMGGAADFAAPGYARALLLEYARYARDEALDVFENNYLALLLAARDKRQVAEFGQGVSEAVSAEE